MKTAYITYYGEGPLNLQMRRFKPGKSIKARLDDILPDERRRYQDRFLVTGPDGLIINIGSMVPDEVAKAVIGNNPQVLRVTGFDVRIPPGYALDDTGAEPKVVEAAVMAAKQTAVAVEDPPRAAPHLTIVKDEEEEDGKEKTLEPEGEGGEPGQIPPGEEDAGEPEHSGAEEALGGGVAGSEEGSEGGEGARVEATDGDPGGEDSVGVPHEIVAGFGNVEGITHTKLKTAGETIPVEESGPDLNDSEEGPSAPAPKAAAKKKAKKKRPTKKKSLADSLLEEF